MKFMNILIIYDFMQVHKAGRSYYTKIWQFSMQGLFLMIY